MELSKGEEEQNCLDLEGEVGEDLLERLWTFGSGWSLLILSKGSGKWVDE